MTERRTSAGARRGRRGIAAVLVLAGVAGGSAVAWGRGNTGMSAWPEDAADLAYVRGSSSGERAVWLGTPGRHPVQISSSSVLGVSPAWSPDGTRLAYLALGREMSEVWTYRDGRHRRVTAWPGAVSNLSWSPDGQSLVADRSSTPDEASAQELLLLDPESGDTETILRVGNRSLGASAPRPATCEVAVASLKEDRTSEIAFVDVQTGEDLRPRVGGHSPAYSLDGGYLAYVRELSGAWELVIADLRSAGESIVHRSDDLIFKPSWRGANEVLFERYFRGEPDPDIWVADRNTHQARSLVTRSGFDGFPASRPRPSPPAVPVSCWAVD